ncbi:twin-arginine translocation signal domain-containing protein [Streptomyces sp. NBC_01511]|uniref:twin-arginine translocation signal domain-containing protein n=1 Tax=unclassified Streptomyces TaxID=2593676 RepID=UPI00386BAF12
MSKISRRSLLGYSGTAAAGAVLASPAVASAAGSETAAETQAGPVEFQYGTEFKGRTDIGPIDAALTLTFTLQTTAAPAANDVTALEVAEALSALAESRGWPPITFYGTPVQAPLN